MGLFIITLLCTFGTSSVNSYYKIARIIQTKRTCETHSAGDVRRMVLLCTRPSPRALRQSVKMASIMEGPLSKWTNVMKGWQYRWFVLDYNAGLLSYYTVSLFHTFTRCKTGWVVPFVIGYYWEGNEYKACQELGISVQWGGAYLEWSRYEPIRDLLRKA